MAKTQGKANGIIGSQAVTEKLDNTRKITIQPVYSVEDFFYNPSKYKSLDLFGKKLSKEVVNLLISGIKVSDTISNITLA